MISRSASILLLVAAAVLLSLSTASSCFVTTKFDDKTCVRTADCFAGEMCQDGECRDGRDRYGARYPW